MSQAIREMEQGGPDDERVGKPIGRGKNKKVGQARKGSDQEQTGINYWKLPYARYVALFKRRLSRRQQAASVKAQQQRIFGCQGTRVSRPRKKYKPQVQQQREVRAPRGETRARFNGGGPVMVALLLLTLCLSLPVVRGSPLSGYGELAAYVTAPAPVPGSWAATRTPVFTWKRVRVGRKPASTHTPEGPGAQPEAAEACSKGEHPGRPPDSSERAVSGLTGA